MRKELEFAKKVLLEAGEEIMKIYSEDFSVSYKGDNDPVTKADLISEKVIVEGLSGFGYDFLTEESGESFDGGEFCWVLDPLDGTKDFIAKNDEFTVMLGLVKNHQVIMGCILHPPSKRVFYARKGEGAFVTVNNTEERLQVSKARSPESMRMLVSRNHLLQSDQDLAAHLQIGEVVVCGSAGLKAVKIAMGEADLYVNTSDKTYEWDICAADVIVEEAGGGVTDLHGENFTYLREDHCNRDGFIVSNGFFIQFS